MGMQRTVTFPGGDVPPWPLVREVLGRLGYPPQLRMIDGQLAFPDEEPPPDWRELRVSTALGMVTARTEPGGVVLVTWGNADLALRRSWNLVALAFAEAGGGSVHTEGGPLDAVAFRRSAELPESLTA